MSSAGDLQFAPGSFRDPTARVLRHDGAILRYLTPEALRNWDRLASTALFRRFTDQGHLIGTERVADHRALPAPTPPWVAILRHEKVPFVSYPYEWPFGMLRDAALLQLDVLAAALDEGMTLKDSSPFNIQWIGARPTFIDIASFKIAEPGEPWAGYRQFCRLFLYPLFLQAYKDVSFHRWLRGDLEGIDARECRRLMSVRDCVRPGVLTHVYLAAGAQARYEGTDRDVIRDLREAGFSTALVKHNVERLRRTVARLDWQPKSSTWSGYAQDNTYDATDRERKADFVRRVAQSQRWSLAWDIGCNTGDYARIVAEHAEYVVAIDADHLAVNRLYNALKAARCDNVLPLVGNVADPSPSLGWCGERQTLEERGRPDLILCLALLHHLVISCNLPLPEVVSWLAGFGADVVVEFVAPGDPMVRRLLRNREKLDFGYSGERLECELARHFRIVQKELLGSGTRTLYHARPRSAQDATSLPPSRPVPAAASSGPTVR
jgi:hypothetical protein